MIGHRPEISQEVVIRVHACQCFRWLMTRINVYAVSNHSLAGIRADKGQTDVLTVLPTGFEKSVVYQVFCFAKISIACVLVISLLINIVVEQVKELGPPAIQSPGKDEDCMNAISEDQLLAHTWQKLFYDGSLTSLPFSIIFLGVLFTRASLQSSNLLCTSKFEMV